MKYSKISRRRLIQISLATTLAFMVAPTSAKVAPRVLPLPLFFDWRVRFKRDLRSLELTSPLVAYMHALFRQQEITDVNPGFSIEDEVRSVYESRQSFIDWFSERTRDDFLNDAVVSVDGLVISRTENELFSMLVRWA